MRPAVAAQRIAATARATAVAETLRRRARTVVGDAAATSTAASTTTTEKHVLQKDFVQVVGSATGGYVEAEVTMDADGAIRIYSDGPPDPTDFVSALTSQFVYIEDFPFSVAGWTSHVVSSGAAYVPAAAVIATNPGVIRVDGGGTSGGACCFRAPATTLIVSGNWSIEMIVKPGADSTGAVIRAGVSTLTTGTSDPVNGLFFDYTKSSSANWRIRARKASADVTTTSSTAVVFNTYCKLRITFDGTTATFFVNGSSIGTIAAIDLPVVAVHPFFFVTHATASGFTHIDVDRVAVNVTGLTR